MKYRVIEKGNPSNPEAPKKQYASAVNAGKFTVKQFAKEIAGRSSLTRGDIENVLTNFIDELPTFLKLGLSVKLGDFGTLRLNLVSEGVDAGKKFTADSIKGVKVIFTAGSELKESLGNITFEEEK
ncbi:MAG: HU family DNA-binding protein [Prevotellaceae bacterium]|jgi:predicted histone-like DNA-binding protein|nr:HU family DNA-binding protein [Prevotellaceae bacterium]